jgi:hypothetical protein
VSLTVGNTIDELREDLWSAELDSAVAQSILRLPASASAAPRPRPTLAPPPPATQTHKVQAGITNRVERALRVTRNARAQGFHVPASGPTTTTPGEAEEDPVVNGTPGV